MLALTCKENALIIINKNLKITVLSDSHSQVKLGVVAPDDVEILRHELKGKQTKASYKV